MKAGLINNVETVAITHFHPDHFAGLGELLWHYYLEERTDRLVIIGPVGLKEKFKKLVAGWQIPFEKIPFEIVLREVKAGDRVGDLRVGLAAHSVTPSLTFKFEESGISVFYSGDTQPSKEIVESAKSADLLFYEATFPGGMEKEAHKVGHSTAEEAGLVASKANAGILFLVHLPYYKLGDEGSFITSFVNSALKIFKGPVLVPENLQVITL